MFQNTADMPRIGKELDRLKIIWRSKNLSIRNHKSHISSFLEHNFTVFCLDCLPRFSIFFTGPLLTLQGSSAACSVSTPPSPFRQAPL